MRCGATYWSVGRAVWAAAARWAALRRSRRSRCSSPRTTRARQSPCSWLSTAATRRLSSGATAPGEPRGERHGYSPSATLWACSGVAMCRKYWPTVRLRSEPQAVSKLKPYTGLPGSLTPGISLEMRTAASWRASSDCSSYAWQDVLVVIRLLAQPMHDSATAPSTASPADAARRLARRARRVPAWVTA
jgi:hypothetical protein